MTHSPAPGPEARAHADQHQEHSVRLYLMIWGLLFVLSAFSYMVDYAGIQGTLRWSLILIFMTLKAGLIMAVFMHLVWERAVLVTAIVLPPIVILVFVAIMALESDYTLLTRVTVFSGAP